MRIHLFLTPNGNIVSFSASLLTKLLIPSETASVLCLGPATSNPHLSALSFLSQELLFLDCFSICDGIKSYILTYTSSGGICCSALLLQYHEICHPDLFFWSVTPLSLLPLRRNSCKHFPYFCFLPAFLSLFLDVMARRRWIFALAFGSIRRGINSTGQVRAYSCCYNVLSALQHYRSVSVKVM